MQDTGGGKSINPSAHRAGIDKFDHVAAAWASQHRRGGVRARGESISENYRESHYRGKDSLETEESS